MAKKKQEVVVLRTDDRYHYDACCDVCGVKHGEVSFAEPRPDWDPRDAGLRCGDCVPEVK